jgi:hypothetical protein
VGSRHGEGHGTTAAHHQQQALPFIDGSGRVAYKELGPITDAILTRVVDSLLATMPAAKGGS